MRILTQRVSKAGVEVDGKSVGAISPGLLLLVAVSGEDHPGIIEAMAAKVANMRLFPALDGSSHFDRSVRDVQGAILVVSQFTLYADCRKGRRPSFISACEPRQAEKMVQFLVECLRKQGIPVETGVFGAHMHVSLVNDGPVTIWLDSEEILPSKPRDPLVLHKRKKDA